MNNPMSHGCNFAVIGDYTNLRISERSKDKVNAHLVIRHRLSSLIFVSSGTWCVNKLLSNLSGPVILLIAFQILCSCQ